MNMRKNLKHFIFVLMVLGLVFGSTSFVAAVAIPINSATGEWQNVVGGQNVVISGNTASWGAASVLRSSYVFDPRPTPFFASSNGIPFSVGSFTHNNFVIPSGTGIKSIDLLLNLGIDVLPVFPATFKFEHEETANQCVGLDCSNDLITIVNPVVNKDFSYLGNDYFFNLLGFSQNNGVDIKTHFSTVEGQENIADLYGTITSTAVPEPLTVLLLGLGLIGVGVAGVRKKLSYYVSLALRAE